MLKTLKWVYETGVKQERVRIASHLQIILRELEIFDQNSYLAKDVEQSKNSEFGRAVNNRLIEIIRGILEPKSEYITTTSIMFPEERSK